MQHTCIFESKANLLEGDCYRCWKEGHGEVYSYASTNATEDWSVTFVDCHNDQLGIVVNFYFILFIFKIVYEKIDCTYFGAPKVTHLLT